MINNIFSSLLHFLILFSVLCILFLLVVSKLEKQEFNEKINDILNTKLKPAIQGYIDNPNIPEETKTAFNNIDWKRLETFYSKPSKEVTTNNDWIIAMMVLINIFFLIILIIIGSLSSLEITNIWYIIIENIIIFSVVGAFEYLFFRYVVTKYVPVKPSTFERTIFEKLWKT